MAERPWPPNSTVRVFTAVSHRYQVREGDPRRVIVDEAKEWPADLIILGARDNALERWLIGSVAQTVVAHAHCSVEVVRRS